MPLSQNQTMIHHSCTWKSRELYLHHLQKNRTTSSDILDSRKEKIPPIPRPIQKNTDARGNKKNSKRRKLPDGRESKMSITGTNSADSKNYVMIQTTEGSYSELLAIENASNCPIRKR